MFGIAVRSSKSQKWNTAVEKSGSGRMRSNTYQLLPSWNISVKYAWLDDERYKTIMGFVALLKGAHKPFWWLDPEDHQEENVQLPKNTDGSYQAVMKMGNYVEPVEKVDQLTVWVDGTEQPSSAYTVNGGVIVFGTAPASGSVVTASYRYYWKVHLPADSISIEHIIDDFKQTGTLKFESWR
jgi:hypothetical protein